MHPDSLPRFLHVCKHSGYRHLGVAKRVQESQNMLECLLGSAVSPWILTYAFDVLAFFQHIEYVSIFLCKSSGMAQAKPKHSRITQYNAVFTSLLGKNNKQFLKLYKLNHKLMMHLYIYQKKYAELLFVQSWLEDHELFFNDLQSAFCMVLDFDSAFPWSTNMYSSLLKFDASEGFEAASV